MENEERKKFIEQLSYSIDEVAKKNIMGELATTINNVTRKKFHNQNKDGHMDPAIGDIVDGYKGFISDFGSGFLEIAENYNECIQIAEMSELIGDVKLKARIKDFSSSSINSNKKELDDVFGVELVTSTEFEKEVLMLFNHLIFDIYKDKKYNKKNGYVAYHSMGDFSPKEGDLQLKIKQILEQAKTREYIYSKDEPNYKDKRSLVNVFTILSQYSNNPKFLGEFTRILGEMVEYMKDIKTPMENVPVIEFHFLTSQVEQEAIRGRASHSNYKKTNTKSSIQEYFRDGRLLRGINAPWKFVGGKNGLELQDFYDTLIENWPFLKDEIVKKRISGKEAKERKAISSFDVLTASQFPFLRQYLSGNFEYPEEKSAEKWGVLKTMIIANRINKHDQNNHSIEDELVSEMDKIWPTGRPTGGNNR